MNEGLLHPLLRFYHTCIGMLNPPRCVLCMYCLISITVDENIGQNHYLSYSEEFFWVVTNGQCVYLISFQFCATIDADTFMATYARSV